ncbi:ComEC/Rec2 family competence protein [Acetobacterium sp.]|jgi:competence protein ComEC|uniref:ComEC/Rec2 family competence protein n=1 Tax=Acetobacterium sp. TaxID=1872094 RepID=UPI002729319A|nr:MBL fold metallo-hydrolase [Acetobacterium sp.]MDO9491594.1 MBL fold metallo-hydrolase [Acetobacterium sp.]
MKRKLLLITALILSVLIIVTGCQFLTGTQTTFSPEDSLAVHFLDVGQGDAVLLVDNNETMLIDSGNPEYGHEIIDYLADLGITQLDYVVATHNHNDHAGGLTDVVANLDVGNLYLTDSEETKASKNLIAAAASKNIPISTPSPGTAMAFGGSVINFLGPLNVHEDVNDDSLVMKVTHGSHRFLLTGDMEEVAEKELLAANLDLAADVLKVGHHGSYSSTGYLFLRTVNPRYAVISCGVNNDYGHPHEETLSRLNDAGSTIFRTDLLGTIIATSEGDQLNFNKNGVTPTQPYQDVDNGLASTTNPVSETPANEATAETATYIGNKNSKVYHLPSCSGLPKESNRIYLNSLEEVHAQGLTPCGICKPPS